MRLTQDRQQCLKLLLIPTILIFLLISFWSPYHKDILVRETWIKDIRSLLPISSEKYMPTTEDIFFSDGSETTTNHSLLYDSESPDTTLPWHLGCYIFPRSLMRYVISKSTTKLPQAVFINSNSTSSCIAQCGESYMYAQFFSKYLRCTCSNIFNTEGLSRLPCGSNAYSAQVYHTTGSQVKYSYLSTKGINCECDNELCVKIQCDIKDMKLAEKAYWVSPRQAALKALSTRSCDNTTVTFISMQGDNSVCFKKDSIPLLPVVNEKLFHIKNTPPEYGTLYYLKGTKNTKQLTIPLMSRSNRTKIAMVTYMRSGSTFFSEFFKAHPDVFYLFEPLRGLTSYDVQSGHETINYHRQHIITSQSTRVMDSLFKCEFDNVPLNVFSRYWRKYKTIVKYCKSRTNDARLSCLQAELADCRNQPMTVIKFIRAKVDWAVTLLKSSHPDLKIVLLVRDPRGIINSRRHISGLYARRSYRVAKQLCSSMVEDIRVAQELAKSETYRKQIYVFRYEDLVGDVVSSAERIYSTMELGSVPDQLKEYLSSLSDTSVNKSKSGFFGTSRKNSMKAAFDWKMQLKIKTAKEIDSVCQEAYTLAGYVPIASEQQLSDENNYHYISDHHIL